MKKLFSISLLIVISAIVVWGLDPAEVTVTNMRGETVATASSEVYYRGEKVNFTNCVLYSGSTTNSAKQDITGLTVILTLGDLTLGSGALASQVVTGSVTTATSGVWNAAVTLRTNEAAKAYFQVKLTDTTNTFIYPFKYLETKAKL